MIDAHRPIHHNNMNAGKKIIIIGNCILAKTNLKDDNTIDRKKCPNQREYEIAYNDFEDVSEEETIKKPNSDEKEEGEGESNAQLLSKIKKMVGEKDTEIKQNHLPIENEENQNEEGENKELSLKEKNDSNKENIEEDEEYELGKKRAERKLWKKSKMEEDKKKAEKKINKYYKKSYMGDCASSVMYLLSQQLNKENNQVKFQFLLFIIFLCLVLSLIFQKNRK